jgi:hypothetical protein
MRLQPNHSNKSIIRNALAKAVRNENEILDSAEAISKNLIFPLAKAETIQFTEPPVNSSSRKSQIEN